MKKKQLNENSLLKGNNEKTFNNKVAVPTRSFIFFHEYTWSNTYSEVIEVNLAVNSKNWRSC